MKKIDFFKKFKKKTELVTFITDEADKVKNTYKYRLRNLANKLSDYERVYEKKLYIDSFSYEETEQFFSYLRNRQENYRVETIRSFYKCLATNFHKAQRKGYEIDEGFFNFKIKKELAPAVSLSYEELIQLNNLSLKPAAARVRDRFLLGCFTAQRFSDYSIISSSDIHDDIIRIRQHKSSGVVKVVEVPVHPVIKQILTRNKGEFPPAPTPQSFNATIKRICKKAGIDKKILIERTEGNKIIKKYIKKYELVGSHTARRTGAALLVYAEPPIRIERILLITGHDCVTTLLDYIRASKEENARGLLRHQFFLST